MPDSKHLISSLRDGLIVSCQAEGADPFNQPEYISLFAVAAESAGARGIRAREPENIRVIRRRISLPIIGITKSSYSDGSVLITPDFQDVQALAEAGADIVALDGTGRLRPNGLSGHEFLRQVKAASRIPLMADVSTLSEGIACGQAGADLIATTLAGYTPYTAHNSSQEPDWELLTGLVARAGIPVVLEGRVWTPEQARHGLELGAFAVVVGTAITRPAVITRRFTDELALAGRSQSLQEQRL